MPTKLVTSSEKLLQITIDREDFLKYVSDGFLPALDPKAKAFWRMALEDLFGWEVSGTEDRPRAKCLGQNVPDEVVEIALDLWEELTFDHLERDVFVLAKRVAKGLLRDQPYQFKTVETFSDIFLDGELVDRVRLPLEEKEQDALVDKIILKFEQKEKERELEALEEGLDDLLEEALKSANASFSAFGSTYVAVPEPVGRKLLEVAFRRKADAEEELEDAVEAKEVKVETTKEGVAEGVRAFEALGSTLVLETSPDLVFLVLAKKGKVHEDEVTLAVDYPEAYLTKHWPLLFDPVRERFSGLLQEAIEDFKYSLKETLGEENAKWLVC